MAGQLEFDVTIEIPEGHRNKYEMDYATGRIRLNRTLFTATRYPGDYGYIDETLGRDNDPLDALVLLPEPTFPGCVVRCRAIGMFLLRDEAGPDEKVICVMSRDPRYEQVRDLHHLPDFQRREIEHFFLIYKEVEPGKSVEKIRWANRAEAEQEITNSFHRAEQARVQGPLRRLPMRPADAAKGPS